MQPNPKEPGARTRLLRPDCRAPNTAPLGAFLGSVSSNNRREFWRYTRTAMNCYLLQLPSKIAGTMLAPLSGWSVQIFPG